MKIIFLIIGAIVSVIIVRTFILDGIEEIYFDIVFESIRKGQSWSDKELELLFNSDTFAKTSVGIVIGGLAGLITHSKKW